MRQQNKIVDIKQEGLNHTLTLYNSSWNKGANVIDALAWGLWKKHNEKGSLLYLAPFQLRSWKANTELDFQVFWLAYNIINKTWQFVLDSCTGSAITMCESASKRQSSILHSKWLFVCRNMMYFVLWCLRLNQTEMTLHHLQNSQSKPKTTP